MKKVLKGEAAARYAYDLAAAVMAGRDPPRIEADYIDAEDLRVGSGRYMKELGERMRQIPANVSEDPAVREAVRLEIAKRLAEAEILVADVMFKLTGTPGREG